MKYLMNWKESPERFDALSRDGYARSQGRSSRHLSYIQDHAPRAATQWSVEARASIKTLANFPERCALSPESIHFDAPIRQMLLGAGNRGTYRVLFIVVDRSVQVIHVRHGCMLALGSEEHGED